MALRIFHAIPSLGIGGAERQLVDVVVNTNRDEFSHVVCHLRGPDSFAAPIRDAGHTVIGLDLPGKRPVFGAASRLARVIRKERPDVVHTWLYDASVSARLARRAMGSAALVTSLQNADYEPETLRAAGRSPLKIGCFRLLDSLTGRWAGSRYVACSRFVEESARRHLGIPASAIRTIYNSVDPETLRYEPGDAVRLRSSLEMPGGALLFVNVGRLIPQKGQKYLLRAFAQVAAEDPRVHLAIVGDGPMAGELNTLAEELGIAGRVRFMGRRQDVGACLGMADAFVFPSMYEGLGIALVEAMFQRLACVASRVGPLPEVIRDGETGLLAAPGSVPELAAAMSTLTRSDELRARLGEAAYADASARFHSKALMPQWESLYRELARGVIGQQSAVGSQ